MREKEIDRWDIEGKLTAVILVGNASRIERLTNGCRSFANDSRSQNEKTRWEHLERIRQHLRFQQCDDFQRQRLLKHLTETAQALPRSDALRQEAWRWLQEQRIVRPRRTSLCDLLTAAPERALQHAFALLACGLTAEQREQLDALLVVPSGGDVETQAGVVTEFWSRSGLEQYGFVLLHRRI
jgi:hypothetical protein